MTKKRSSMSDVGIEEDISRVHVHLAPDPAIISEAQLAFVQKQTGNKDMIFHQYIGINTMKES
jgi:hypothetical protein